MPESTDPTIAQLAAEWVARRDRGLSARQAAELAEWERADPRHSAALAQAGGAWRSLNSLRGVAELETMAEKVVRRARLRQARRRAQRWSLWAVGAAAAVMIGFMGWPRMRPAPAADEPVLHESVRVLSSTLRSQALPDGSIAELNGASRIEVDFTGTDRRVRLVSGEAHFIVAKNPERPFYVTAGPITVRALGTAFNVRLAAVEVEVLVTEGKVQVEAVPATPRIDAPLRPDTALIAGQRAVIECGAGGSAPIAVGEVGRSEIDETLAWQGTRLVFNRTTLDEVVAAFNRYNNHRLMLGDPKLRERTLTGSFRADNLEGFLRLVRQIVDVKAELRTPSETVLLPVR